MSEEDLTKLEETAGREERIDEIIARYLNARESGSRPSVEEILARGGEDTQVLRREGPLGSGIGQLVAAAFGGLGHLENQINAFQRLPEQGLVVQVAEDDFNIVAHLREVVQDAAAEIIQHADGVAAGRQGFDKVRADEARTAGDKTNCHSSS